MNTTLFFFAALAAVLLALAFILVPLLADPEARRRRRRLAALEDLADELDPEDYRARKARLESDAESAGRASPGAGIIVGLVLIVPAATWLLYQSVGEPEGISPGDTPIEQVRSGLIGLARELERDPDGVENWVRLGMAYKDLEEFSSAQHAFRRALYLDPDSPFVRVELAETLLFASQSPRLPEESRELLERAVEREPENQKALWLLGIGAFQRGDYRQALAHWQELDALLPEGSVRGSVREQMARARRQLAAESGDRSELPPDHPPLGAANGEDDISLRVEVSVAPELADQLEGDESVFVIARAADGPSAPLAVARRPAHELPFSVSFGDGDAMVEGLELSSFDEVVLTARISASGNAEARAGDLQGESERHPVGAEGAIGVIIDRRLGD